MMVLLALEYVDVYSITKVKQWGHYGIHLLIRMLWLDLHVKQTI